MTAPHAAQYPRPADWKQFERLSIALMSCVFGGRFDQYGREGQRQDGVDLFCNGKDGSLIAVQCKGRNGNLGKKLTVAQLNQAVLDAETFPFKIDRFFVLTTSPHDKTLTNGALQITTERRIAGKGSVEVWGWESLENIIREHQSLQDSFYSQYQPKLSVKGWMIRASLISSLVLAGFIGAHKYLAYQANASQTSAATIDGLTEYMALNDQLIDIYDSCLKTLDKGIFTFSYSFQQFCIVPVEKTLNAMEHQVQHASLKIDTAAIDQLHVLVKLLNEDLRQGLITNLMVTAFEDGMVDSQKALCPPHISGKSAEILEGLRKPAVAAMKQQLEFYFILRDFILPGLQSMQANVVIAARNSNQRGVSDQMRNDSLELSELLAQRHRYRMEEPQQPFTLSAVKHMTSREIKISGDLDTMVEDARYGDVLLQAIQASVYGKHDAVQELIKCGVYKKEAASIIEHEEEAINASAVRPT